MDLQEFCTNTHSIKVQYTVGLLERPEAIKQLADLYADFFGLFTASYHEALLSDFYIDEE